MAKRFLRMGLLMAVIGFGTDLVAGQRAPVGNRAVVSAIDENAPVLRYKGETAVTVRWLRAIIRENRWQRLSAEILSAKGEDIELALMVVCFAEYLEVRNLGEILSSGHMDAILADARLKIDRMMQTRKVDAGVRRVAQIVDLQDAIAEFERIDRPLDDRTKPAFQFMLLGLQMIESLPDEMLSDIKVQMGWFKENKPFAFDRNLIEQVMREECKFLEPYGYVLIKQHVCNADKNDICCFCDAYNGENMNACDASCECEDDYCTDNNCTC